MTEVVRPRRPLPPPWDRIAPLVTQLSVWGLIFGILFLLRSFSLLIFMTFVFAYIQAHAVDALATRFPNRALRTFGVALALLLVLIGIGSFIVPKVKSQTELFASRYTSYLRTFDGALVGLSREYPLLDRLTPETKFLEEHLRDDGSLGGWSLEISPTAHLLEHIIGYTSENSGENTAEGIRETLIAVKEVGAKILAIASAFLLSLLFSFLIVLDLPRLAASVRSLADTKLRFIYLEAADNICEFSRVLGRALEAQLLISLLNTVLTGLGIYLLGLGDKVFFLSTIVFLCSFIPVAGVFLSSVPICLIALQEGGLNTMLLAIGLILLIHMIEAYVLNPKIFGKHLHINPVLVLIILTISGKLFAVWGLVLGVPICTYFFTKAIVDAPKE